jgi:tetratricopeptide (TPR) repeat protein
MSPLDDRRRLRRAFFVGLTLAVVAVAPALGQVPDPCGPSGCGCIGPNCGPPPSRIPSLPSRQPQQPVVPTSPLAEADRLLAQGRYPQALDKYYEAQKALLWSREKCKADFGLGMTYLNLGKTQEALFWFMSANEGGCPEAEAHARRLREQLPPVPPPARPTPSRLPSQPVLDYEQMVKALEGARTSGRDAAVGLLDVAAGLAKSHLAAGGPPKELAVTLPAVEFFSKGGAGSAIVDLRDIPWSEVSPLDPRVTKGSLSAAELKARDIADAKICDADDAIAARDWAGMVRHLRAALRARPNDEEVRRHVSIRINYRNWKTGADAGSPRTTALLDALELAPGDWGMALSYLREEAWATPDNPGIRDAYYLLVGWAGATPKAPKSFRDLPTPSSPIVPAADELFKRAVRTPDAETRLRLYREAHRLSPENQALRDLMNMTEGETYAERWREAAGGGP